MRRQLLRWADCSNQFDYMINYNAMKKPKTLRPITVSTMHSKKHRLVAVAFTSSDREYIFELPIIDGKRLVVGLTDSIRKAELPLTKDDESE